VGWMHSGYNVCDVFVWKDGIFRSIDNDEFGNSLLGDYSYLALDSAAKDRADSIIIKHQNSAIYKKYILK